MPDDQLEQIASRSETALQESRGDSPGALVSAANGPLMEYFSSAALADALKTRSWSLAREMDILMDIAEDKDGAKPSERMQAAELLHKRRLFVLELEGGLRRAKCRLEHEDEDGRRAIYEETGTVARSKQSLGSALDRLSTLADGDDPT